MPASRRLSRSAGEPAPPAATATRSEYTRRRLSTAAGLYELRQWRHTSAVLAAYTAAVIAAVRGGTVALSSDALHTAWVDLINTGTITNAVVKAAFTLAVILTLPLAASAASVAVRLRPWRPHSGRSLMWATPPQRLRTDWPAWRAAAQAHMLTDHAASPIHGALQRTPRLQSGHPVHLIEPGAEPPRRQTAPEPQPDIHPAEHQPKHEPQPDIHPTAVARDKPQPDIHPTEHQPKHEPQPDIHPTAVARDEPATGADSRLLDAMAQVGVGGSWTDDLAGEEWEDPSAPLDDSPSLRGKPEAPAAAAETAADEPKSLVFWLFGPNKKLSAERESMLALLVANNRRLHLKDGARILGLEQATLRMRFTRASKEGWTQHSGISYWSLSDRVTTDLEMLITAVADEDENMASQIAERVGPPLPALRAEWLDNRAGGPTPREELRAAADTALARAAELWPTNRAFVDAVDRLYDDD